MANAAEYTDPYLSTYTPVPAAGPGICVVCHSGPRAGYATCYSCTTVRQQVSRPIRSVVPISLYALNSQLWHVLRYYKDGTGTSTELLAMQVAAIIARFTSGHLQCVTSLLGGQPDVVTSVPSTRVQLRRGRHPLETAITRVGALAFPPRVTPDSRTSMGGPQQSRRRCVRRARAAERRSGTCHRRHAHHRRTPAERGLRAAPERGVGCRCHRRRKGHQPGLER